MLIKSKQISIFLRLCKMGRAMMQNYHRALQSHDTPNWVVLDQQVKINSKRSSTYRKLLEIDKSHRHLVYREGWEALIEKGPRMVSILPLLIAQYLVQILLGAGASTLRSNLKRRTSKGVLVVESRAAQGHALHLRHTLLKMKRPKESSQQLREKQPRNKWWLWLKMHWMASWTT